LLYFLASVSAASSPFLFGLLFWLVPFLRFLGRTWN